MNIKDGLREDNCNPILLEDLYKKVTLYYPIYEIGPSLFSSDPIKIVGWIRECRPIIDILYYILKKKNEPIIKRLFFLESEFDSVNNINELIDSSSSVVLLSSDLLLIKDEVILNLKSFLNSQMRRTIDLNNKYWLNLDEPYKTIFKDEPISIELLKPIKLKYNRKGAF